MHASPPIPPASGPGTLPARRQGRAERDALHERILRSLESGRPRAGFAGSAPSAQSQSVPDTGQLRNLLGDRRQPLVDYLNDDFMPLAGECIDEAELRNPRLEGMVGIGMEIVADEQLGGVIDSAEPSLRNEILDQELIECIRQTALTVILPSGLITGREQFEITLRIGTREDAAPRP